jgi:hypothetical protein
LNQPQEKLRAMVAKVRELMRQLNRTRGRGKISVGAIRRTLGKSGKRKLKELAAHHERLLCLRSRRPACNEVTFSASLLPLRD